MISIIKTSVLFICAMIQLVIAVEIFMVDAVGVSIG